MDTTFSLNAVLSLVGFGFGLILGILLILNYKKNKSWFLLGLFLLTYSVEFLEAVLVDEEIVDTNPTLLFLPIRFYFLFAPLLYLYAKSIFSEVKLRSEWKHLWPGTLEILVLSILFLFPAKSKLQIYQSVAFELSEALYILMAFIYINVYLIITIIFINRSGKKVLNNYSNTAGKKLWWVKGICYYILALNASMILSAFVPESWETSEMFWSSLINTAFVILVAVYGFQQSQIELSVSGHSNVPQKGPQISTSVPVQRRQVEQTVEYKRLVQFLQKKKPYRDPQLSLVQLAKMLQYSPRKLSQVINENSGQNFNIFINHFRVEEAKEMLENDDFQNLNHLGVAKEVGFNSKSTFYKSFRQITGTTPAKFQKSRPIK